MLLLLLLLLLWAVNGGDATGGRQIRTRVYTYTRYVRVDTLNVYMYMCRYVIDAGSTGCTFSCSFILLKAAVILPRPAYDRQRSRFNQRQN